MKRKVDPVRELRKIVTRGEGPNLEFKHNTSNVEKMVKELVAFANTEGGKLLVGVADNGQLWGLKRADEEVFQLKKAISKYVFPPFQHKISVVALSEKKGIITVDVPKSRRRPHFFKQHQYKAGLAFIRINDECVATSKEQLDLLRIKKKKVGILVTYGDFEQNLLNLIEKTGETTVEDLTKASRRSRQEVSEAIVKLVAAEVVLLDPKPGGKDLLSLSNKFEKPNA